MKKCTGQTDFLPAKKWNEMRDKEKMWRRDLTAAWCPIGDIGASKSKSMVNVTWFKKSQFWVLTPNIPLLSAHSLYTNGCWLYSVTLTLTSNSLRCLPAWIPSCCCGCCEVRTCWVRVWFSAVGYVCAFIVSDMFIRSVCSLHKMCNVCMQYFFPTG